MTYKKILLFSFFLALWMSCAPEKSNNISLSGFFDLKEYFKLQQKELIKVQAFRKTIRLDKQIEEKTLTDLNVVEELAIFSNSDINKNAWFDKYTIDSILQKNQLVALHYNAIDKKLKTKKLSIYFTEASVDSIHILNQANNIVVNSSQTLKYIPSKGYHIFSNQMLTSQPEHALTVDVEFVY